MPQVDGEGTEANVRRFRVESGDANGEREEVSGDANGERGEVSMDEGEVREEKNEVAYEEREEVSREPKFWGLNFENLSYSLKEI